MRIQYSNFVVIPQLSDNIARLLDDGYKEPKDLLVDKLLADGSAESSAEREPAPAFEAATPITFDGRYIGGKKSTQLFAAMHCKPIDLSAAAQAAAAKPVIEDATHVKAKDPSENLRFEEVQNNLKTGLEATKNEWMTP